MNKCKQVGDDVQHITSRRGLIIKFNVAEDIKDGDPYKGEREVHHEFCTACERITSSNVSIGGGGSKQYPWGARWSAKHGTFVLPTPR